MNDDPEIFTPHPHAVGTSAPDRATWLPEYHWHVKKVRNALEHVLDERGRNALVTHGRDDKARIHFATSEAVGELSGPGDRQIASLTVNGLRGDNVRASIPVLEWHPERARDEGMAELVAAFARSAIDHIDAIRFTDMEPHPEFERWAMVHLSRLMLSGRMRSHIDPTGIQLHLVGADGSRPANAFLTTSPADYQPIRYRSADSRDVAPDIGHERVASMKTDHLASGRTHVAMAIPPVAIVTISDLPRDPTSLAALIRADDVPELVG